MGVGPDGAFAGDEARREGYAGERGVVEQERERRLRREREERELVVGFRAERAFESERTIGGDYEDVILRHGGAGGELHFRTLLGECPERVRNH